MRVRDNYITRITDRVICTLQYDEVIYCRFSSADSNGWLNVARNNSHTFHIMTRCDYELKEEVKTDDTGTEIKIDATVYIPRSKFPIDASLIGEQDYINIGGEILQPGGDEILSGGENFSIETIDPDKYFVVLGVRRQQWEE